MARHEKYNINEASKDQLTQIPGVDENTAEAIIQFRERRGWINNIEELKDVKQIDAHEMGKLHEWLTLADERTGFLEYEGKEEEPDAL